MNTMLPTNDEFVEKVAIAIGRNRMYREAIEILENAVGIKVPDTSELSERFDHEFQLLWNGTSDDSEWNREGYKNDARAAINSINLLLLTMTM